MWKYIVTPIIGAIIGYVTNWIAVKMLFRPRKEGIWKETSLYTRRNSKRTGKAGKSRW